MADRLEARSEEGARSGALRRSIVLLVIAAAGLALVACFGWYQFSRRAAVPVRLVKEHPINGAGVTIGEGIERFIRDKGVKVVEKGFKPSWGAEETGRGVFVVSYVYEVGRQARWISWQVLLPSGRVIPRGGWARELWSGD